MKLEKSLDVFRHFQDNSKEASAKKHRQLNAKNKTKLDSSLYKQKSEPQSWILDFLDPRTTSVSNDCGQIPLAKVLYI